MELLLLLIARTVRWFAVHFYDTIRDAGYRLRRPKLTPVSLISVAETIQER